MGGGGEEGGKGGMVIGLRGEGNLLVTQHRYIKPIGCHGFCSPMTAYVDTDPMTADKSTHCVLLNTPSRSKSNRFLEAEPCDSQCLVLEWGCDGAEMLNIT